jgi:ribosomal protein RSM22 (predicted rRNA methylase)
MPPNVSFFHHRGPFLDCQVLINRLTNLSERQSALLSLQQSWKSYNLTKNGSSLDLSDNLNAYLQYYFPLNVERNFRIWYRHRKILEPLYAQSQRKTLRLLDLGCGPLTASFGLITALQAFCNDHYDSKPLRPLDLELCLLDQSSFAIDAGVELMKECQASLTFSTRHLSSFSQLPSADVLLLSNFVNELEPRSFDSLKKYLSSLAFTEDGPYVLLVEPAQQDHFPRFAECRDLLASVGGRVLAPCLHSLSCPMAAHQDRCYHKFLWTPPTYLAQLSKQARFDSELLNTAYCAFGPQKSAEKGWGRVVSNLIPPKSQPASGVGSFLVGPL